MLVRRYVVDQVQSLGYRTLAVGNASEAMAIIDASEEIDLLFTDVVMPGSVDGRQLAVEAPSRRPSLKILYTSGYSENAMIDDGHLEAGELLLAKPYRKGDLAKMIRAALAALTQAGLRCTRNVVVALLKPTPRRRRDLAPLRGRAERKSRRKSRSISCHSA